MKADIGLIFKYILAIIIPLIVYFGIGGIAKDIYFSIWEIVDSTTLEEKSIIKKFLYMLV